MTPSNYKEEIREKWLKTDLAKEFAPFEQGVPDFFLAELDRVVREEREAIRKRVENLLKEEFEWETDDYVTYSGRPHIIRQALLAPSTDKGNKHE